MEQNGGCKVENSVIYAAYKKDVPIFIPAFSDCSAGFGFVMYQTTHPDKHASRDSAKDFLELTNIKLNVNETGIIIEIPFLYIKSTFARKKIKNYYILLGYNFIVKI
jgi:deoxyhypusine synthase